MKVKSWYVYKMILWFTSMENGLRQLLFLINKSTSGFMDLIQDISMMLVLPENGNREKELLEDSILQTFKYQMVAGAVRVKRGDIGYVIEWN